MRCAHLERTALWPRDDDVKISGVVVVRDGGDAGHWLLHQTLRLL
jgi:hypothetical protein